MNPISRTLITIGALLIVAGLAWQFGGKYLSFLGKLPGDIAYKRENVRIYFPLATSLLLSLVLSVVAWIFRRCGS